MSELAAKLRLYFVIWVEGVKFRALRLYRAFTKTKHPKGWPAEQEWNVALMAALFKIGTYKDWRKLINVLAAPKAPGLAITAVPATTFSVSCWRESYWVELQPELQPKHPKASIVVLFVHGGGFVFGHPLMYRTAYQHYLMQLAAKDIHMRFFAVGYPLAPESPFPAALEAIAEAYDWLVKQMGGSANIILAGDSAGGNLAICSLVYMRERARGFAGVHTAAERPAASKAAAAAAAAETASSSTAAEAAAQAGEFQPPQAAILISPAVDMTDNSTIWSRSPNDELFKYDYVTPGEDSAVGHLYVPQARDPGSGVTLADPLVTPLALEDFSGLVRSKLLVVTGGCEALAPDIHRFVDHVHATNPEVQLQHHVEPDEPHCYLMLQLPRLLAKGQAMVEFIAEAAAAAAAVAEAGNDGTHEN